MGEGMKNLIAERERGREGEREIERERESAEVMIGFEIGVGR